MILLGILGVAVVVAVFALLVAMANEVFYGASVIAFALLIYPAYVAIGWLANL